MEHTVVSNITEHILCLGNPEYMTCAVTKDCLEVIDTTTFSYQDACRAIIESKSRILAMTPSLAEVIGALSNSESVPALTGIQKIYVFGEPMTTARQKWLAALWGVPVLYIANSVSEAYRKCLDALYTSEWVPTRWEAKVYEDHLRINCESLSTKCPTASSKHLKEHLEECLDIPVYVFYTEVTTEELLVEHCEFVSQMHFTSNGQ